jgi:iron complex outermembrane receptor protein
MVLLLATLVLWAAPQPDAEAEQRDLTRLSIEELANIQVETVSRRPESRIEASGAVHVITEEDIRRSGITTLPDAVRLSPGVQASRIDADEWALAVRGFASRLSRSVLVTLDGRSLWTPLFAGVFWDQHDTSLFDLDRIEVSRGPYGALFGANAVNGIISIVTKGADRTHGGLLNVGVGTAERLGTLRYGGEARPGLHYRAWGQYRRRDGTTAIDAGAYDDRWTIVTGGFRSDWIRGDDTFTLRGGVTDGEAGQRVAVASFTAPFSRTIDGEVDFRSGHLLGRWQHGFAEGGHVSVQAYYDRTRREEPHYHEIRDTVDLDAQHRVAWGGRHDFVWGLNARRSHGDFRGQFETLVMEPAHRADDIVSVFAQDEVRAGPLRLSAGAKAEWNDYSGWQLMPSARAAVLLGGRHNLWTAVSRAARTSSRVERDILLYFHAGQDPAQPVFARLRGSDAFLSESVVSYEAGYKARLGSRVYLDVTGFHGVYDDLATNETGAPVVEPGVPPAPARVVVPFVVGNGQEGSSSGVEASATAVVRPGWRVQAAHSFLRVNQSPKPGTTDANEGFERNSPRHQFWAASYLTLGEDKDLDLTLRRIGEIPGHRVEAFTELDARVAWRPRAGLELAVVGENLLRRRHPEFGGGFEIDRAVRARATVEW